MTVMTIRSTAGPDGAISAATPRPPGEYQATITVPAPPGPGKPFTMDGLPIHDMGRDGDGVLVYASREPSPFHARATVALPGASSGGGSRWFSRQVLREDLAVVTPPQPTEPALSAAVAVADATGFLAVAIWERDRLCLPA